MVLQFMCFIELSFLILDPASIYFQGCVEFGNKQLDQSCLKIHPSAL